MMKHVDVVDIVTLIKDKHNSLTEEDLTVHKNKGYQISDDAKFTHLLLTS